MLLINSFLQQDYPVFMAKLSLIGVLWFIVLGAVVIDLMSGVHKARSMAIARTSFGFHRTVSKIVQYYSVLIFALMFDVIGSLVLSLPYFTMLGCAFLVFIEAKSVYENAEQKVQKKAAENLSDLIALLENRDDLLTGIVQILKRQQDETHA